jgi:chemotaxis regulatin CheY-phosphate phosphatase CheZ
MKMTVLTFLATMAVCATILFATRSINETIQATGADSHLRAIEDQLDEMAERLKEISDNTETAAANSS